MPTFEIEDSCPFEIIAGVDEAGRGPLCGPVVAGAVVFVGANNYLPLQCPVPINDSKQMTARQREAAFEWLTTNPDIFWAVGMCSPAEIDEINILQASLLAMKRAVAGLPCVPGFILVDGNRLPPGISSPPLEGCPEGAGWFTQVSESLVNHPGASRHPSKGGELFGRAIVQGDSKSMSIAAASIIAKVTRDRMMCELGHEFPMYGWDKNAGYPTSAHLQAMAKYGINAHYRKTFSPVAKIIKN